MAEPKPLASLSAGLLARKGAARPAMRRQAQLPGGYFGGSDDLGWNDMGYDVNPGDGRPDIGRAASHGLSPMAGGADASYPAPAQDDALSALDAAVERTIEPLRPDYSAEDYAPAVPEVHLQQERIVTGLNTVAAEPEAVVAETAPEQAYFAEAAEAEPVVSPVLVKRSAVRSAPAPRANPGTRGSFAFTLRLDPARHLRLRLATAASNRSAQQTLIALLDDYLATLPEIDAFATGLPAAKPAS